MRKIVAITQISMDGVMQGPGGPEEDTSNGFTQGGWAMQFGDDTLNQVMNDLMAGEFDMLLGRRTYDIFAGYWPNHNGNAIGKAFNRATKYVATNGPARLEWEHSHSVTGDVVAGVNRLKALAGPEIHVWGSSNLLQTLIAASLVDEYRLWIAPVVLGRGKRLFENQCTPNETDTGDHTAYIYRCFVEYISPCR